MNSLTESQYSYGQAPSKNDVSEETVQELRNLSTRLRAETEAEDSSLGNKFLRWLGERAAK